MLESVNIYFYCKWRESNKRNKFYRFVYNFTSKLNSLTTKKTYITPNDRTELKRLLNYK